jgi:acyl carrier protein
MGLDTVDLLMKIEDHFSISIPNKEAEQITTVQDYYNVVARHLNATPEEMAVIQLTINQLIADHAGLDLSEIEPHKSITNDLGLD